MLCLPGDIVALDSADGKSLVHALTWVRGDIQCVRLDLPLAAFGCMAHAT